MYRHYQSDKDRYLEYVVRNCRQVMINQLWFNNRQATSRYLNQWWPNYMVPYGVTHGQWGDKCAWWRHQMETFSALLAICAGNSPVTGEFPTQRPVTRSFDVFFDLRLNKRLRNQSWGWWFETLSRPLWRQCNESSANLVFGDSGSNSSPVWYQASTWTIIDLM